MNICDPQLVSLMQSLFPDGYDPTRSSTGVHFGRPGWFALPAHGTPALRYLMIPDERLPELWNHWIDRGTHQIDILKNELHGDGIMKKLWIMVALLAVMMFVMPAMAATLYAGKNIPVGEVQVSNDADNLYVEYHVTVDGWAMTETHLAVASSVAGIPQAKGNPIPGQFAYSKDHMPAVTDYTYTIPLTQVPSGSPLYIAAHAAMVHTTEGCIDIVSDTMVDVVNDAGEVTGQAVVPNVAPWDGMGLIYPDAFTFPAAAQWIWPTAVIQQPVTGEIVEFSKTFTIPATAIVTSADMYVTCDNGYELNVNNAPIASAQLAPTFRTAPALTNDIVWWYDGGVPQICGGGPYGWQTVEKWDISGALQTGINTLQLTGVNEANTPDECPFTTGDATTNPAGCKFSSADDGICYNVVDQKETAWGAGSPFLGRNWATYFTYKIPEWNFIETVSVPAKDAPLVTTTVPFESGKTYKLVAKGTAWANEYIEFDAKYSFNNGDGGTSIGWTDLVFHYESWGPQLLDLYVNNINVDWGAAFNSDHEYEYELVGTGTPATFQFQINDFYPSNDYGSLTVDIYKWA